MNRVSIILAIDDEKERERMFVLLLQEGYCTLCVDKPYIPTALSTLPVLVITDTNDEGTAVVRIVADLVRTHDDLAVIFVLPRQVHVPHWGDPFIGKTVGFLTTPYPDKEFTSYVRAVANKLGRQGLLE